jgi:hypothetical protein
MMTVSMIGTLTVLNSTFACLREGDKKGDRGMSTILEQLYKGVFR